MPANILEVNPATPSFFFKLLQKIAEVKSFEAQFSGETSYVAPQIQEAAAAYVDLELSGSVLKTIAVLPTLCRSLQALDSFFKEDGTAYPRLLFYEAIQNLLVQEAPDWDNREPVFVVGSSEAAKVAAAAVCALGAKAVYLIGDPLKLNLSVSTLHRFQLGIQFQVIASDQLTATDVSGGLLLNTVDLKKEKDLLISLSYFNFLNPHSYVVDLCIEAESNDLVEEARKASFLAVGKEHTCGHWTACWWNQYFANEQALSPAEATKICQEFLR